MKHTTVLANVTGIDILKIVGDDRLGNVIEIIVGQIGAEMVVLIQRVLQKMLQNVMQEGTAVRCLDLRDHRLAQLQNP